ncbi:peptidoglycan DD-metalloendopeptidase family protein [Mesorhizobium sp. NPDC059054]|uniref:peptidoglycan DD-metalloendopeptidase family protein n=1 Tax=Mesorhizobium sp. NPDC059054 TaxID=3346711 RepID=UPI003679A15C
MQFKSLKANKRNLTRGCAMLLVIGAVSGCSSQVARFGGVDTMATASTDNQRSIITKPAASQPYPGDAQYQASNVNYSRSSVTRSSLSPVSSQPLPTVAQATAPAVNKARSVAEPIMAQGAAKVAKVDQTVTGGVNQLQAPVNSTIASTQIVAEEVKGWSRAGGTQITAREGETVYNLSRRYGVPADVLMKTNGLASADGLKSGQKLVIPTYVYTNKAPVSAPDNDPNVADAKSSRGTKYDVPADKVPLPGNAPVEKVAVLPQQPKVKEGKAAAQVDTSAAASDPKAKLAKEAQVAAAQPKGGAGGYTVQQGDTLSSIARKTGVSTTALKQANGMQDGLLRIGQTLKVPAAGAAPAAAVAAAKPAAAVDAVNTASIPAPEKPSATLATYTPPKKDQKVIQQAESDAAEAPDATGIGKMRWPVRGRVISGYKSGTGGIDIAVPEGTPVKAAENGVVIYAGDGLKEFGNTVLVRHEDGLVTVYGHASSLEVQRGQKVKRGQEIARSGMSGTTESPKLHFEVRKNSSPVDPQTFLE